MTSFLWHQKNKKQRKRDWTYNFHASKNSIKKIHICKYVSSPKKIYKGPVTWDVNIISYQGNINQNHNTLLTYLKWRLKSEVAQSCPTLCDSMDCSLWGSCVHGIFQARGLEWVAISFSRGSSRPRDPTQVSRMASRRFTIWATREAISHTKMAKIKKNLVLLKK